MNFANPMVIFYWFSVMTLASERSGLESEKKAPILLLLGIIMSTFFLFDLLKILGAKKLRPLMTKTLLKSLNQLIGIVFIGFGTFLLINGFLYV